MIRALLILAMASTGVHADEPITFKGFVPGVSEKAAFEAAFPKADNGQYGCPDVCVWTPYRACSRWTSSDEERKKCYELMSYGGIMPTTIWITFKEGKFVSADVHFLASKFDDLAAAITQRFGEPSHVENGTVQNRAGATFPNKIAMWNRAGAIISVHQRAGTVDEGVATVTTTEVLEKQREERDRSIKSGAKSL